MSTFFVNGPSSYAVRGRSYAVENFEAAPLPPRRPRRWPLAAVVLLLVALSTWQLGGAA